MRVLPRNLLVLSVVLGFAAVAFGAPVETTPHVWTYAEITGGPSHVSEAPLLQSLSGTATFDGLAVSSGDISAADSGVVASQSVLDGHDGLANQTRLASSEVVTARSILIEAEGHAAGTAVTASLSVYCEGVLQALEQSAGKLSAAAAGYSLKLLDGDGAVVLQRDGNASVTALYGGVDLPSAGDAWVSSMTETVDGDGQRVYEIDYAEVIEFDAVVGQSYWVLFDLSTTAMTSPGGADGESYPATASSVFRVAGYDVAVTAVPEPGALALFVAGGGLMIFKRRVR